jgi:hypothetical protein
MQTQRCTRTRARTHNTHKHTQERRFLFSRRLARAQDRIGYLLTGEPPPHWQPHANPPTAEKSLNELLVASSLKLEAKLKGMQLDKDTRLQECLKKLGVSRLAHRLTPAARTRTRSRAQTQYTETHTT